jgi:hypothetical protein
MGAVMPGRAICQASATCAWCGAQACRGGVECRQHAHPALVEVGLHARAAHAAGEVGLAAVLAGEEAARQAEVVDDPQALGAAQRLELGLVQGALDEVVVRLQRLSAAGPGAGLVASASARRGAV